MPRRIHVAVIVALIAGCTWLRGEAQELGDLTGGQSKAKLKSYVSYTSEPMTITAGRRSKLEVRLRVAEGFHINSHQPGSELLLPAVITWMQADEGVIVGATEYPAGSAYRFAADQVETLDVYTGTVVLRVPVTAAAGEHTLRGSLRYQACDDRACYPPKTLPIAVDFVAQPTR